MIHASRAAVYAAFVDPNQLVRWLPPTGMWGRIVAFEPRVDGEFEMTLTYIDPKDASRGKTTDDTDAFHGRFAELVPNEKVVWAVEFHSEDPGLSGEMRVTAMLTDTERGVVVEMRCDDIPAAIRLEDNEEGSRLSLANLAELIEGEK